MTPRSLSREIAAALAFKVVALAVLYFLFFDHAHRRVITPGSMMSFLVDKRMPPQR